MINFTIIESNFMNQLGEKKFFSRNLFFSTFEYKIRNSLNDLSELSLEINSNNQWILRPLSTTTITINSEQVTSPVLIKPNDMIVLGNCLTIKINDIKPITEKTFHQFSGQSLDFFKQNDNQLINIIKKISNES